MYRRTIGALSCAIPLALKVVPAAAIDFPTRLFLSSEGAALSSFPHRQTLSRNIEVRRTQGTQTVPWMANSNQPWLTVTTTGMTGDPLKFKANPKHVKRDQLNIADVTVTTTGGDFSDSETLRVGLWVGSGDPSTVKVQQNATFIATNPVEPVAYVSDGGGSIRSYNVYAGAAGQVFKTGVKAVGAMEVSGDGRTLFAADTVKEQIIAVDLSNGKVTASYPLGYPIEKAFNLVYARPFGQPAIYPAGGPVIAVPSGETLASLLPLGFIAVTPDGEKLSAVTVGDSPATLSSYALQLKNDQLSIKFVRQGGIQRDNCQDIAISADGKHVYPACGGPAPYVFPVYDWKTQTLLQVLDANPYPNNIELDQADRVIGGLNGLYQLADIYVFNQKGDRVGTVATTKESYDWGQQNAAGKVSGDGTRVISVTAAVYNPSQTLMFRSLP